MAPANRSKKGTSGKKGLTDKTAWLKRGLGKQIATFDADTLTPVSVQVSSDSAFEDVCSYSWAKRANPSIYVPGAPPRWTSPTLPVTVPQDTGAHPIDHNAWKMPSCPFTPLFSSLRTTNPSFSFSDVDLLANRNSLRKLLDFVDGRVGQTFRIDATLVRNTLVLQRRERSVCAFLPPTNGAQHVSFGHGFEAAMTTPSPGLEESTSHHRTIAYNLGELKCVVQFEVDAWYEEESPDEVADSTTAEPAELCGETVDELPAGIEDAVAGLSLRHGARRGSVSAPKASASGGRQGREKKRASGTLEILKGDVDYQPPGRQLAEIKVRSKKPYLVSKAIPQMWFGRTPYLISGVHDEGVFSDIKVERVGDKFSEWEDRNQGALKKLVGLIAHMRELLMDQRREVAGRSGGESGERRAWAFTYDHKVKPARLVVHELAEKAKIAAIPQEYVQAFWAQN
ncbi:putative geranylgeranyl pyrophosphate synthetase [Diplodia seriata]|uniref:Putative geranylgeranyl pyrophosphate synthetase n=1 Tax=Diplodia seriata TaxID=420778 RepID=A0A0G2EX00_9PEZI|nr:putative geranylgeranyl pyrophosphate synthetase [Diplodia seriata]